MGDAGDAKSRTAWIGPRHLERAADVRLDEVEARLPREVLEVPPRPGDEVVDAGDAPALGEEAVDEVAADEPGSAEDDRSLFAHAGGIYFFGPRSSSVS